MFLKILIFSLIYKNGKLKLLKHKYWEKILKHIVWLDNWLYCGAYKRTAWDKVVNLLKTNTPKQSVYERKETKQTKNTKAIWKKDN